MRVKWVIQWLASIQGRIDSIDAADEYFTDQIAWNSIAEMAPEVKKLA